MLIGVVSDSHGYEGRLSNVLMRLEEKGPLDALIHLGDGNRDLSRLDVPLPPIYEVAGNCDFFQSASLAFPTFGGAKLLITHGHVQRVKQGLDSLYLLARERGVQAALYGHTHIQRCEIRNGILLLNPGAAMDGHGALLEIDRHGAVSATLY